MESSPSKLMKELRSFRFWMIFTITFPILVLFVLMVLRPWATPEEEPDPIPEGIIIDVLGARANEADSLVIIPQNMEVWTGDEVHPWVLLYFAEKPTVCVILEDGKRGWLEVRDVDRVEGTFRLHERGEATWFLRDESCEYEMWSSVPGVRITRQRPMRLDGRGS